VSAGGGLDRRKFMLLAGGGIAVFVALGLRLALKSDGTPQYPEDFNAYLLIGKNGRVAVYSGKIEMGQGVMTSQAQMLAEELGVSVHSIDMVLGDTDLCPFDFGTFGSLTTRMFGPALRAAGAKARAALIELAAKRLGVAAAALRVDDGVVSVAGAPQRRVSFAELAGGARITRIADRNAVLRTFKQFRVMGRSVKRLDGEVKVTGAAKYAADLRLPEMLYASILRPPMHGAMLMQIDTAAAARMPGVTIVNDRGLIAALHADPQSAAAARQAIRPVWSLPATTVDSETIYQHLAADAESLRVIADRGDVDAARKHAARVTESTFLKGYVAHAPMEPHAALAEIKNGRATVWASTQTPFPTRDRIAAALGMGHGAVRVITPYLGGGFGGKSADTQAVEAARLAQISGRPVQVAWTRAEEFFNDTFDPAAVVRVASAVDAHGRIALWDYAVHGAGERGAIPCYGAANLRVRSGTELHYGPATRGPSIHPFAVGPWRAPGANMNIFATESQIDIMAAAAAVDPLEFRLRNLADARLRRVLEAAAAAFGWTRATAPSKRGYGIACSIDAGTYVATIAAVGVDSSSGSVKVSRIVCAQDMGIVVNPDGARMQMEGGITMGLGYTLAEELQFRGGDILDQNFGTYHIPRFSWVPRIETVLVENNDVPPQGGGEPAITATGGAIANAVYDATGARLLRLPMTPARVRAALGAMAQS